LKVALEGKFNLAAMPQVVERHRVTLNPKLQCISSNLSLVASKNFKELGFNDERIQAMAIFAAASSLSDLQLEVRLEKGFLNFYHPTFKTLQEEAKKEAPSSKTKAKPKEEAKVEEDHLPQP
jgi:arginyl-tRNA--protein-N-Asp/Glu arginylyltransferase